MDALGHVAVATPLRTRAAVSVSTSVGRHGQGAAVGGRAGAALQATGASLGWKNNQAGLGGFRVEPRVVAGAALAF